MSWPTDPLIGQQIILVALIGGFLLLAGLCLSARAFTQLLELIARHGFLGKAHRQADQPAQTTLSKGKGKGKNSAHKVDAHITSGTVNIELEDK